MPFDAMNRQRPAEAAPSQRRCATNVLSIALVGTLLAACGGGGDGAGTTPPGGSSNTFTVGGSVTGLTSGSLVIEDNGSTNSLTLTANGSFVFGQAQADGAAYAVTIAQSPAGLSCAVTNGSGTVAGANVTRVAVACTPVVVSQPSLVFRTVGETTNTGAPSGVISLQAVDAAGNVAGPTAPVTLASTSTTMTFSTTPDFATPITSVSLATDHATFYFRDTTAGSPTITAATPGYADATLAETVVSAITERGTVNLVASGVSSSYNLVQTTDGTLYGVASGVSDPFVYSVDTLGVLTKLHIFDEGSASPTSGLLQASDGNFYGTVSRGTLTPNGGIYRLGRDGTYAVVYAFTGGSNGSLPQGGLVQGSDGRLYGTTFFGNGPSSDCGTAFAMTLSGALTTLHVFTGGVEGCEPEGGLIQASDGLFYGSTSTGGTPDEGTLFTLSATGQYSLLHALAPGEGEGPAGRLVEGKDGALYGTTMQGGTTNSRGTFFRVTKAGAFTVLYGFATGPLGTQDGYYSSNGRPNGTVIQLADGNFYGTTGNGGAFGAGTVYQISPSGSEVIVHSFQNSSPSPGSGPSGPLLLGIDGKLYGTAGSGGPAGAGTVFSMSGFF